jgi:hypothetical protein
VELESGSLLVGVGAGVVDGAVIGGLDVAGAIWLQYVSKWFASHS